MSPLQSILHDDITVRLRGTARGAKRRPSRIEIPPCSAGESYHPGINEMATTPARTESSHQEDSNVESLAAVTVKGR